MESITCLITIILALYFVAVTSSLAIKNEATSSYTKLNMNADEFIKSLCRVTLYPDYKKLSGYAGTIKTSHAQLANASLNVTLGAAQNTSAAVDKMLQLRNLESKEAGALRDCVETLGYSVDELRQSMAAMKYLEARKNVDF